MHHVDLPGTRGVMAWEFADTVAAISSAAVGGGTGPVDWILNVGVFRDYARTDLSAHATEVAGALALTGSGTALFTAADLTRAQRAGDGGVIVDATVGINPPTWAAADESLVPPTPGTINIVVQVPVALDPGAAVNAVITATEAKTQAMIEAGIAGTGTASDAVVVVHRLTGPLEPFAGPRSEWGARIARAVHAAVTAGIEAS